MSEEPYTNGVDFILSEVIRYAQMPLEELRLHLKDQAFQTIKDRKGRLRIAGRPAIDALKALTRRALEASQHARHLDFARTYRVVENGFGTTFIRGDIPNLTEAELEDLFSGWISTAALDCRERWHIIPCDLALVGVESINIGP